MSEVHRRTHVVSHFQIDIRDKDAPLCECDAGGTLVMFAKGHIKVATAWDDNATVPPLVEIVIARGPFDAAGTENLVAIAQSSFECLSGVLQAGNFITGDVTDVPFSLGAYRALVWLDTSVPMAARHVRVHFIPE